MTESKLTLNNNYTNFIADIKQRVLSARYSAAAKVNSELILLYHHIGSEIIKSQQLYGWGAKIIDQLSADLRKEFPEMKRTSTRNLKYMRKFAIDLLFCYHPLELFYAKQKIMS